MREAPLPAGRRWAGQLILPLAVGLATLLTGCATGYAPGPLRQGDSIDTALQRMGAPTGEYLQADGGRRLEFARGPFGRHTYMLDFDVQGRLVRSEQVLTEAIFGSIQPGITAAQLREKIGRPARVWAVRYHDQTVWSYRYDTPFCQLFHVGITPAGIVEDTSYGPDPACEVNERRNPFAR